MVRVTGARVLPVLLALGCFLCCAGALYQFPPLCSSVEGILLLVSFIFFADGAENRAKSLGFARSGALGLPG